MNINHDEELFIKACKLAILNGQCSASLFQRRLLIGFARAARLMDQLEENGVISPSDGTSAPRRVLVKSLDEIKFTKEPWELENEDPKIKIDYSKVKPNFYTNEIILGKNEKGVIVKADLQKIGNLIIEGNSISTKFEFINIYLKSLINNFDIDKVRLILFDSFGQVEKYSGYEHLLTPLIVDQQKLTYALRWVLVEIDRRLKLETINNLPRIIVVIHLSYYNVEVLDALKIISSFGFKYKINLILLTNYPSDIPKSIRDNIPAKLEFAKFGEYEAVYKFKEKIKLKTQKLSKSEK